MGLVDTSVRLVDTIVGAQVANTATKYEQPMYEAYSVAVYTT